MRTGRASRTAEHNALFRALEATKPAARRVCDDPLARAFLGRSLAAVVALAAVPGGRSLVERVIDGRWPGVRTSVVARTRLIDEVLGASVDDRTEQVAILGAGFDTRAYRLPALKAATVFEVDHPDTQAAKRAGLRRVRADDLAHVGHVTTDFNEGDLEAAMAGAGFREDARTVYLWEGVTNYLTEDAVDRTLRWCARSAPGSTVVFTYVHRDVLADPGQFVGTDRLFTTLDNVGERFTFGIDPASLPAFLAERGLELERDVGAAEYRALAYGEAAAAAMRGHEFYRVAAARVA